MKLNLDLLVKTLNLSVIGEAIVQNSLILTKGDIFITLHIYTDEIRYSVSREDKELRAGVANDTESLIESLKGELVE